MNEKLILQIMENFQNLFHRAPMFTHTVPRPRHTHKHTNLMKLIIHFFLHFFFIRNLLKILFTLFRD